MTFDNVSPTVLLVDGFNKNSLTRGWLESNGYRVREAANVFDALEEMTDFTQEFRPSLIMLNSAMSVEDSSYAMSSLHNFTEMHEVPIVALTADDHGAKSGQDEYFVQAKRLDTLKSLMSSLLPVCEPQKKTAAATVR
jgi:CheY-like chemotaxis protein